MLFPSLYLGQKMAAASRLAPEKKKKKPGFAAERGPEGPAEIGLGQGNTPSIAPVSSSRAPPPEPLAEPEDGGQRQGGQD
jgi:hypothetical protein